MRTVPNLYVTMIQFRYPSNVGLKLGQLGRHKMSLIPNNSRGNEPDIMINAAKDALHKMEEKL